MIGGDANKVAALSFSDVEKVLRTVISNLFIALVHSGLLILPLLVIDITHRWQHQAHRVTWAALIATLTVALIVAARVHYSGGVLLPLQSYLLVESGVGPVWVYDMVFLDNDNMTPLPIGFWRTITAMALGGAVLLVTALTLRLTELVPRVVRREATSDSDLVTLFPVLTLAGYFSLLLPSPCFGIDTWYRWSRFSPWPWSDLEHLCLAHCSMSHGRGE